MTACECDWSWHRGARCSTPAEDNAPVRSSPALCTQCLFVCCGEREDAEDAAELVEDLPDLIAGSYPKER